MKTSKKCLQCNQDFEGEQKRLYCSDRCKVKACRAGKTRQAAKPAIELAAPPTPRVPIQPLSKQPRLPDRPPVAGLSKLDLDSQRITFDHARQMKRMDLNENKRRRKHEQELAHINADGLGQAAKVQQLAKQVADLQQEVNVQRLAKQVDEVKPPASLPLEVWSYFPLGIRRQYQALVRAALKAVEEPMPGLFCQQWLAEYGAYDRAVQELTEQRAIPTQMHTPFIWLAGLAQQLAIHERATDRSLNGQGSVFLLSPALRQQLTEACL